MSHLNNANSPIGYTPTTPGDWIDPDPTNVQEALDTLATEIAAIDGSVTEKSWTFTTPSGSTGTFYAAGFYDFGALPDDFSPSITHGIVNNPYAAHLFVVLGSTPVDTLTVRVSGTSFTDAGVRTTSDTEDIVLTTGDNLDDYFETSKKWIGQVTISIVSGAPILCNYGFAKYWDNSNLAFTIKGWEATWVGGANDAGADIHLHHHDGSSWTYNASGPPAATNHFGTMSGDYVTEKEVKNNEQGAWKRTGVTEVIRGDLSEGFILEIIITANKAFELGNFILSLTVP